MSATRHLLREALRSRNPELAIEAEAIIQKVTPLLWHSLSTFPSGTSHTPQHTTAVELIADMLIPADVLQQLTDDELQLLILSCHFHDLGMSGTEFDNQTRETQEQTRIDHAVRIGEIIENNWQSLGFRSASTAEALAEVCRGHRPQRIDGRADWNNIRSHSVLGPNRAVRLRLLSSMIFAADELHIGSDRAPQIEEAWLQIENAESRRHWRRHQMVEGPVIINDVIHFDCRPTTFAVENDLRRHVLRKALGAVNDARAQLAADQIRGSLRTICVNWIRDDIWRALIVQRQSDHTPRSTTELVTMISEAYVAAAASGDILESLCIEMPSRNEISDGIARSVDDFETRTQLVPAPGLGDTYLLNVEPREARHFFTIVRKADGDDVLFAGRYAQHHEFNLLRSEYGKAFTLRSVVPIVEAGFGVNLKVEQTESPVLVALQGSPTATRMLLDLAPSPSVLVKRHLLRLTVLNGASLDLLRSPDLLLNRGFRHAIKRLSQECAVGQPGFLRLIEELALVGGYSYEQVHDAMLRSEAATKELEAMVPETEPPSAAQGRVILHISQSIPPNLPAPTISFPYLVLAGARGC